MEVVYYQGSHAHQYLQDVQLLDDDDIQSAVPQCLAHELSSQDEQNHDSNMQDNMGEQSREKNKYNISIGLVIMALKNYKTILIAYTIGILVCRIKEILITDIYQYIVLFIVLSNAMLIRIIKYDFIQREEHTQIIISMLTNFRNIIGQLSVHRDGRQINLLFYHVAQICEPIYQSNMIKDAQLLDNVTIQCEIIRIQKQVRKQYEQLFFIPIQYRCLSNFIYQIGSVGTNIIAYQRWVIKSQSVSYRLKQYYDQIKQDDRNHDRQQKQNIKIKIKINRKQYKETIIGRLQKYLQKDNQMKEQVNNQRIIAILNLLKLQLKYKYNNIKMNMQLSQANIHDNRQEQNIMKQNNQHDCGYKSITQYLSMSTEGQLDRIQHQQIGNRIGILKGQLDIIIQAKFASSAPPQPKQQQKVMLVQHERRIQGFGSIFKSANSRPVQQYYIQ